MKNIIQITLIMAIIQPAITQDRYTDAMKSTLEMLNMATENKDLLECAGKFERIAAAEKDKWLPCYYGAYALIQLSFNEEDGTQRDLILDRAQEMIDYALKLSPEESELHVLQAFLYPSRIIVDPMSRGMLYIDRCFASLEKAKTLDPENPRTYFLEAMNKLNMPPSFGGGPDVARPIFTIASEKFKKFKSPDPLWPDWGADANKAELAKLKE